MIELSSRDIPNIIHLLKSGMINGRDIAYKALQTRLFMQKEELIPGECVLGYWEGNFPHRIRGLGCSPIVIFLYRRNYIDSKSCLVLGITGSRVIDDADKARIQRVFREILPYRSKIVIVTGGASGIDSYCINRCIQSRFRQIIVVPVITRNLIDLYTQNKGVDLVALYPSGTGVERRMFLERNSIIAALCDDLIVFRAGEYSGSINMANSAMKLGRKVFVNGDYEFGDSRYFGNEDLLEKGCPDLREFKEFLDNFYKSV